MKNKNNINFLIGIIALYSSCVSSTEVSTQRISLLSNDRVSVWKTIIYPNKAQILKMHRHENDRVVVALDDGLLKVTNDKGKVHYLKFKKGMAYFLNKDVPNELHNDENLSGHQVKVIVIELKDIQK